MSTTNLTVLLEKVKNASPGKLQRNKNSAVKAMLKLTRKIYILLFGDDGTFVSFGAICFFRAR